MARKSDSNKKPGRKPLPDTDLVPKGYEKFLGQLKEQIRTARPRAAIGVNRELIELYWRIGKSLVERQRSDGWGKSVVVRLARDLQSEFPGMSGFSPRNEFRIAGASPRNDPRSRAGDATQGVVRHRRLVAPYPTLVTPSVWSSGSHITTFRRNA